MTLEEFRKTRRHWSNLNDHPLIDSLDEPQQGLVYYQGVYIEIVDGEYMLTLGNEGWITDDLASLEEKLYEWAKDEGVFEDITIEQLMKEMSHER